jgi:hypothetical protein
VVAPRNVPTTKAPLKDKGELGNGVTIKVSKIESVKGVARGPGEVAGPALRISIHVDNESRKTIPMNLALVNVYYGKGRLPASPLSAPGAAPLSNPIPPSKSDTGKYVFGVPKDQRSNLQVEFSYTTEAPTVLFSGSV